MTPTSDSRTWVAPLAVVTLLTAATVDFRLARSMPLVDFWHLRAVPAAHAEGLRGDLYSREYRERLFDGLVRPVAERARTPAEARRLSWGEQAALVSAELDVPFLGYEGVETLATPFLFACFSPFARGSFGFDATAYALLLLAAFFASTSSLLRLYGWPRAEATLLAGVLGLVFEPLASELRVGNVNTLQLSMTVGALALLARGRMASAGVVLAVAVMFKPNLAIVAATVAMVPGVRRQWSALARLALGGAAGAAGAAAASAAFFGSLSPWAQWLDVAGAVLGSTRGIDVGNLSLTALVGGGTLAVLAILVAAFAYAVSRTHAPPAECFEAAIGAGLVLMLLSSRLVWMHYYLLALPALLRLLRRSPASAWVGAAALLLFTSAWGRWAGAWGYALAMNAAALTVLGVTVAQLLRAPPPAGATDASPASDAVATGA